MEKPNLRVRARRLDVPTAPKLLGGVVGLAVAEGALPAGRVVELYEAVEDTERRRSGAAEALKCLKVRYLEDFRCSRVSARNPHILLRWVQAVEHRCGRGCVHRVHPGVLQGVGTDW